MTKPTIWDTDQVRHKPEKLQKKARSLKFWIKEEEGLYYMYFCSENKGADQLCSYCTADLCLCFRIYADCLLSHAMAHLYEPRWKKFFIFI